jgi:hypothetical protein
MKKGGATGAALLGVLDGASSTYTLLVPGSATNLGRWGIVHNIAQVTVRLFVTRGCSGLVGAFADPPTATESVVERGKVFGYFDEHWKVEH